MSSLCILADLPKSSLHCRLEPPLLVRSVNVGFASQKCQEATVGLFYWQSLFVSRPLFVCLTVRTSLITPLTYLCLQSRCFVHSPSALQRKPHCFVANISLCLAPSLLPGIPKCEPVTLNWPLKLGIVGWKYSYP